MDWMWSSTGPMSVLAVNWLLLLVVPLLAIWHHGMGAFIQRIVGWLGHGAGTQRERELVAEIQTRKQTQSGISMMDEFAKHAKIERKLVKLRAELALIIDEHRSARRMSAWALQLTCYALTALVCLFLAVAYGREPVIVFQESSLLYPFQWLTSCPTGLEGAIGLPFWTFVTRTAVAKLLETPSPR